MKTTVLTISLAAAVLVSGCAAPTADRAAQFGASSGALSFKENRENDAGMVEQTAALDALMRDIVRNSTIKHAAVGAAVGCGISVLAASDASGCLRAAAAGGVVGAVSGNLAGKREVAQRMELFSANDLVRSIRKSNDQLDDITTHLPQMLAQQQEDVATLNQLKASGAISEDAYDAQLADIRTSRAEVAEALVLSADQAKLAQNNLAEAADQGQPGLEWHIRAIEQMERETLSARSTISLL